MVSVVASAARAVMPGVAKWYGIGYDQFPAQYSEIYTDFQSEKNFEEFVNYYGLGQYKHKPETAPVGTDDFGQGWAYYIRPQVYALSFALSREAIMDNLYEQLAYARAKYLGIGAKETMENLGAYLFDHAFDTNNLWPDGQPLCSTSSGLSKGGTFSNAVASPADLSEASIEQMRIQMDDWRDDAGNRIQVQAKKLLIPKELRYDAERILGNTTWRPGTMDRDIPALAYTGTLPDGYMVNNYLGDPDAYFMLTNSPDGFVRVIRELPSIENDTPDFEKDIMRVKGRFRVGFGVVDKRAVLGNVGGG